MVEVSSGERKESFRNEAEDCKSMLSARCDAMSVGYSPVCTYERYGNLQIDEPGRRSL